MSLSPERSESDGAPRGSNARLGALSGSLRRKTGASALRVSRYPKDGTERWLEMFVRRIECHRKPAVHATFVDITDRKMAEQALRRSEEKYKHIAEKSIDRVGMAQDGKIVYANDAYGRIFGYEKGKLSGHQDEKPVGSV